MPTFFDVHAIADELAMGKLIICSNQRLASRLQTAYAVFCRDNYQQAVVDAPRIFSLETWTHHSWQQLLLEAHPLSLKYTVLGNSQQQILWEQIIKESGLPLLRPAAAAQQAAAAYKTLLNWRLNFSDKKLRAEFHNDEDASTFLGWADEFDRRCEANRFIPTVRIATHLLELYHSGDIKCTEQVLLVGFENLAPLEQALLEQLGPLTHYYSKKSGKVKTLARDSQQQEIYTAATWAKQQLKNSPEQTVAVVIPDLAQQRGRVQRIFQEVFEPGFADPFEGRKSLPFNISAGYALIEAPVISAAMDALCLHLPEVDIDLCYSFIASPFHMLDKDDEVYISLLAAKLNDIRRARLNSSLFRQLAEKVSSRQDITGLFSQALQKQASLMRSSPKTATAEYWAEFISEMLLLIGWPGKRSLDSEEYQQLMQWQSIIEEFSSLDLVINKMTYSEAVSALNGLLSRQLFQPQTADSSLQVLGTLEAAGLQFDHLWLASMSDQQWPANPSPNPLLPYSLQRDHNMPHATAERELEFATNLLQRFISSAGNIIASYCNFDNGNAISPSPLIARYPQLSDVDILGKTLKSLVPTIEIRRRHLESALIETTEAGDAPKVKQGEMIRGGSSLFASQSACPFKAFARNRLSIEALKKAEIGLNAADRGTLLHRALELIWVKLKDQNHLLALEENALKMLCESTAEYTLNDFEAKHSQALGLRFRLIEKQRISHLLFSWLQIEKQRANFSIKALEARHKFRYAELELQTRIDRIDELDDGSLLIMDYKSSKNINISRWWGDRPEEPQLPLYHMLLSNTENISGVAFAKVNIDEHKLLGVGSESSPEPAIRFNSKLKSKAAAENWQQLTTHWQRVLESLAQDFINGVSTVDPKKPSSTCTFCDLSSVCRVNQLMIDEAVDASA